MKGIIDLTEIAEALKLQTELIQNGLNEVKKFLSNSEKKVYSVGEAAKYLKVSRTTIFNYVKQERLKKNSIGKFNIEEIERFLSMGVKKESIIKTRKGKVNVRKRNKRVIVTAEAEVIKKKKIDTLNLGLFGET